MLEHIVACAVGFMAGYFMGGGTGLNLKTVVLMVLSYFFGYVATGAIWRYLRAGTRATEGKKENESGHV